MSNNIIAIIGDMHGCYFTLVSLFNKIKYSSKDIYCVGDLIDRGTDSKSVVRFCIENNIKPVMGNHEYMMLNAIEESENNLSNENNYDLWTYNGGNKTMISYGEYNKFDITKFKKLLVESNHYNFIKTLPLSIEIENVIITHAGIVEGTEKENVLWNRRLTSELPKFQVFGHTVTREVEYVKNHFINIDTGCVYKNKLTAAIINTKTMEVLQIVSEPMNVLDRK